MPWRLRPGPVGLCSVGPEQLFIDGLGGRPELQGRVLGPGWGGWRWRREVVGKEMGRLAWGRRSLGE